VTVEGTAADGSAAARKSPSGRKPKFKLNPPSGQAASPASARGDKARGDLQHPPHEADAAESAGIFFTERDGLSWARAKTEQRFDTSEPAAAAALAVLTGGCRRFGEMAQLRQHEIGSFGVEGEVAPPLLAAFEAGAALLGRLAIGQGIGHEGSSSLSRFGPRRRLENGAKRRAGRAENLLATRRKDKLAIVHDHRVDKLTAISGKDESYSEVHPGGGRAPDTERVLTRKSRPTLWRLALHASLHCDRIS
jgi:hypothetical protein